MNNNVAIVVVTYNRKDLLIENLKSLKAQTYSDFDIYVIDNASTDGTKDAIAQFVSNNTFYVNTGSNLGGAGGFKYGIKHALQNSSYKYIWIMDDDTIPEQDALESLIHKADILNGEFSYLSSVVKWIDGSACLMNLQIVDSMTTKNLYALSNGLLQIKQASFVSCLIDCAAINEVGLPISEFFIYGDDVEYTERLGKYKPGFLDVDSIVIHKMKTNVNTSIVSCDPERISRYKFQIRNYVFMAKKNGLKGIVKNFIYNCKLFNHIIHKSKSYKWRRIRVLITGVAEGIAFNPRIEKTL